MLMVLALLMPETVRVLEVATELNATPVWAVKLKAVGDGVDRYRQSGDVERTAHATDGEGRGSFGAVAVGSSLLHGDRLAVGYRAGS